MYMFEIIYWRHTELPKNINAEWQTSSYRLVKLLYFKEKTNLASKQNKQVIYKGKKVRLSSDFFFFTQQYFMLAEKCI